MSNEDIVPVDGSGWFAVMIVQYGGTAPQVAVPYTVVLNQKDVQDIVMYLRQARDACQEWFSFIPPADVSDAVASLNGEWRIQS